MVLDDRAQIPGSCGSGAVSLSDQAGRRVGLLIKLGVFLAVLVAVNQAGNWIMGELSLTLRPSNEVYFHRLIMTALVIYMLLMALPFVPGVEVGMMMMALFGAKIVPLVYLATVVALVIAFVVGHYIPQRFVLELLEALRLPRAKGLLQSVESLGPAERADFLLQGTSSRWVPFLLKHKHMAVAVALNVPGNAVIGGGGGISVAAGFSGLFSLPAYALTISLAVAPVPIAMWLTGS
jgi:hypothetical protein